MNLVFNPRDRFRDTALSAGLAVLSLQSLICFPSSLIQAMVGDGFPSARQLRITLIPSVANVSELLISSLISGGTRKKVRFNYLNFRAAEALLKFSNIFNKNCLSKAGSQRRNRAWTRTIKSKLFDHARQIKTKTSVEKNQFSFLEK